MNKQMIQTLGAYILAAKAAGKTVEECRVDDYHAFLAQFAAMAAMVANMNGVALMALNDVNLADNEYAEIVDQVYVQNIAQLTALRIDGMAYVAGEHPGVQHGYFERYVEGECHTQEERNALNGDVDSFWRRLLTYMRPNNQRAYGLAVGRVQSGKTRNYIGLMFKAIDDGYNAIVILTSKNSRLAVQTHKRVFKWLGAEGLSVPNFLPMTQVDDAERGVDWIGNGFTPNRVHVGVVLKNESGHLDRVRNWIDRVGADMRQQMKLLLIDDESDSATPNTRGIGGILVDGDEDAERVVAGVRASGAFGAEAVANWMARIANEEWNEATLATVKEMLRQAATMSLLRTLILENEGFRALAGLDINVAINGQNWSLRGLVWGIFHHKATRKRPCNWRLLHDYLCYAFGVRQERSRINRTICQLVGQTAKEPPIFNYAKMVYVGYTATPFANMLNENPKTDPLCPDCIKPLTIGSKYFGFERIFGGVGEACNMNIVRTIPDDEYLGWVRPLQDGLIDDEDDEGWTADLRRSQNFATEDGVEDVREVTWTTLAKAVKWAFCSAASRRVRRLAGVDVGDFVDIKHRWTTMLFNVSHLSNQETGVHPVQQRIVERYLEMQLREENRERFVAECLATWDEEVALFGEDAFAQSCAGYGQIVGYPDRAQIECAIRDWFVGTGGKYKVVQLNSAVSPDADQPDYNDRECEAGDVLWILCGGNVLARGLTLEGLTVSYFDRIRSGSAVDTITQMARWFGYRPGYELLPRIWMTPDTVHDMKDYCRIEQSLHSELAALYDSLDRTSIRLGRPTSAIRFFGHRLSGRDANGIVFQGNAPKGVFDKVMDNPEFALEETNHFLDACGAVAPVPETCTRVMHTRHRLYWAHVQKQTVYDYIDRLRQNYFVEASRYAADGLLHEISNSVEEWNVVVGNPNRHGLLPVGGNERFDGYLRRNNSFQRLFGGQVSLGKAQMTSGAFMARIPTSYLDQADAEINGGRPDDMDHVEAAHRLVAADPNGNQALLNPTLLIDFVNGGENHPAYVQVSFYWHGHSEESYFGSMTDPYRPTLIPRAVEILNERGYMSFSTLCRFMEIDDDGKDSFREELVRECQRHDAVIGMSANPRAKSALINSDVVYSVEWADAHRTDLDLVPEWAIGYDLYNRIIENQWNTYHGHMLDFHRLEDNGLNWIIFSTWCDGRMNTLWQQFRDQYAAVDRLIQASFWYHEGCAQREAGNLADGLEKIKMAAEMGLKIANEALCRIEFEDAMRMRANPDVFSVDALNGVRRSSEILLACAQRGYAPAVYAMGEAYEEMRNQNKADQCYASAAKDMPRLAEAGDKNAQLALAKMFAEGKGLAKDIDQAKAWCQRLKDSGNADAEALLVKLNGRE